MTRTPDSRIPRVSIRELIERYDLILFDAYGVLVHSAGTLPGAQQTISRLNELDKPYAVLTNDASKLPETAVARYRGFGLDIPVDRIVSSGSLLTAYFEQHRLNGARCIVLGTPDSHRFVELAGGEIVPADSPCDVLVVGDENGFDFVKTVDATLSTLFRAIDAGNCPRLVLPNPDLIFPHGGDRFGIAAGSIALIIEAALRRRYPQRQDLVFDRLGKPHSDLYEAAMRRFGTRNAVMIGDQLETDIAGALSCGIDCALIATGVSVVKNLTSATAIRPTYWIPSLSGD